MVIPGSAAPSPVQALRLFRDPIKFLLGAHRSYGDVFEVRFPGEPPIAYLADPDHARTALGTDNADGVAAAGETRAILFEPLVGESSLLTLDGERWERERALLGPAFHGERIDSFREQIREIAAERLDFWPLGEPLDLRERMSEITLEVILRVVFGLDEGARHRRLRELLPRLVESAAWYAWVPGSIRGRLERIGAGGVTGRLNPAAGVIEMRDEVDRLLREEIAERRAATSTNDSETARPVISLLLDSGDGSEGLSDDAVRDELVTLLAAGHETTSTALAWAFERLMRTPAALDPLVAELPDDRDGEYGSYLDAAVKETLRARPVVIDVARVLHEPVGFGAHEVPAGWMVAPAIVVLHHREDIWGDPERFRPERFLDDPPLHAWIPFGGGRRRCLGSHLAQLEMKVVIGEVLSRFRLEPTDPAPERARLRHVTLVPEHGARAIVTPA